MQLGFSILLVLDFVVMVLDADQLHLEVLAVLMPDGLQNQTGEEGLNGGDGGEAAGNEGGELGHQAGPDVLHQNGNEEAQSQEHQHQRNGTEEQEGLVVPEQLADGLEDLEAVGEGVQLGFAALGTVPVGNDHVGDEHIPVHSVDAHFSFNLKALAQHGEALDELVAEGTAAGHDVLDIALEQQIDA